MKNIIYLIIGLFFVNISNSQSVNNNQYKIIKKESKDLLIAYENYFNLTGDINEPINDRQYHFKKSLIALFVSPQSLVYNDLDPKQNTSREFSIDEYARNMMTWFSSTGIKTQLEINDISYSEVKQSGSGKYYINVYVNKSVSGTFLSKTLHRMNNFVEFRISFNKPGLEFSNFRIAGIQKSTPIISNIIYEYPPVKTDLDEMVFVEGGCFMMGTNSGDFDEKPVHKVCVDDFFIGKYEVTQKQWERLMGPVRSDEKGDELPVVSVGLYEINQFIEKLNTETGYNYRLPTEAEWEFAARGGNKSKGYLYSGSDDPFEVAVYNVRSENDETNTHSVGSRKPNELGIYDMSGNVWEWCSDYWSKDYYKKSPKHNPKGPSKGEYQVSRGGSWLHDEWTCRVENRTRFNPANSGSNIGIRLVRDVK